MAYSVSINFQLPAFIWSEEFQRTLLSRHFKAFDVLRRKGFFIGEFVWNFADFKTSQCTLSNNFNRRNLFILRNYNSITFSFILAINRVDGNKKGLFTRQRQPKESAHFLRKRYLSLAKYVDNSTNIPKDTLLYVISKPKYISNNHIEL